jgi:succinoglycan biosynthesis transport protein ExoP
MQPQDAVTITRRPLDFEDYVDIVRRHRSWIFGPTLAALVIAVVVAYLWPDTYVSTATIRIIPPQVPQSLVQSNLNMSMSARLASMEEVILSRATLTNIITTFGLYKKELASKPMDDVVEQMRTKDIKIVQVQDAQSRDGDQGATATAFQVSFSYENRFQAQKVTNELVSRFITENLRNRTDESAGTTQFLNSEVEAAKKRLDEAEQRMSDFRAKNMGRLPDQMQANMQALNGLQVELTSVNASISRVTQDKLLLENQIKILKDQLKTIQDSAAQSEGTTAKNDKLADLDRQIASLETNLTALRQRYKETYPDVQTAEKLLADARQNRAQLLKEQAAAPAPVHKITNPQTLREAQTVTASIERAQAQLAAKDLEMQQYQKDLARIDEAIKNYQTRIESAPIGEKEYGQLLADVELARREYADLNMKYASSRIATNLENRRQGETLELLDPASLPQTPTQPKRYIIVGSGLGFGLLIGLIIAGVREIKDSSLKNLKDVRAYTQLAILGSVPLLENDLVVRRRRRLGWLAWSTACLVSILIMSGSILYYYATRV